MTFVVPPRGPSEDVTERRVGNEPVQSPAHEAIVVEHVDRDRDWFHR